MLDSFHTLPATYIIVPREFVIKERYLDVSCSLSRKENDTPGINNVVDNDGQAFERTDKCTQAYSIRCLLLLLIQRKLARRYL